MNSNSAWKAEAAGELKNEPVRFRPVLMNVPESLIAPDPCQVPPKIGFGVVTVAWMETTAGAAAAAVGGKEPPL